MLFVLFLVKRPCVWSMYILCSGTWNVRHVTSELYVITWIWKKWAVFHVQSLLRYLKCSQCNIITLRDHLDIKKWTVFYAQSLLRYVKCPQCNIRTLHRYLDLKKWAVFHVQSLLRHVKCSQCNIRSLRDHLDMKKWTVFYVQSLLRYVKCYNVILELYMITWTWKNEQCSMYNLYSGTWNVLNAILNLV